MKRVLPIIGLVISSIVFLVMLRDVLFVSLDGIGALPIFGGLCYLFTRMLIYRDKEIWPHLGWVLIVNGIILAILPIGVFSALEVVICVVLVGSGVALVVRSKKAKAR